MFKPWDSKWLFCWDWKIWCYFLMSCVKLPELALSYFCWIKFVALDFPWLCVFHRWRFSTFDELQLLLIGHSWLSLFLHVYLLHISSLFSGQVLQRNTVHGIPLGQFCYLCSVLVSPMVVCTSSITWMVPFLFCLPVNYWPTTGGTLSCFLFFFSCFTLLRNYFINFDITCDNLYLVNYHWKYGIVVLQVKVHVSWGTWIYLINWSFRYC